MSESPQPPIAPIPSESPLPPSSDGKATASLILGICTLFLWLCPLIGLAGAITGLVLGIQSRKRHPGAMATAGIILCVLGGIASLINMVIGIILALTGGGPLVPFLEPLS